MVHGILSYQSAVFGQWCCWFLVMTLPAACSKSAADVGGLAVDALKPRKDQKAIIVHGLFVDGTVVLVKRIAELAAAITARHEVQRLV
jgi:hypothetical protein